MSSPSLQVKSKSGFEKAYAIPKRLDPRMVDKAFAFMVAGASLGEATERFGLTVPERKWLEETVTDFAEEAQAHRKSQEG